MSNGRKQRYKEKGIVGRKCFSGEEISFIPSSLPSMFQSPFFLLSQFPSFLSCSFLPPAFDMFLPSSFLLFPHLPSMLHACYFLPSIPLSLRPCILPSFNDPCFFFPPFFNIHLYMFLPSFLPCQPHALSFHPSFNVILLSLSFLLPSLKNPSFPPSELFLPSMFLQDQFWFTWSTLCGYYLEHMTYIGLTRSHINPDSPYL